MANETTTTKPNTPTDDEKKARVALLLAEARAVYEVWLEADLPVDLALALRDKKPFEKLPDAAIEGVCRVVGIMRRMSREAKEQLEKEAAEATKPAAPPKAKNGSKTTKTAPAQASAEVGEKTT